MSLAELKDRSATLATKAISVAINVTSAGSPSIRAIQPGQLFLVYGFYIQNLEAADVTLTWKSGSTAISGAMVLVAKTATAVDSLSVFSDIPILKGRAKGDDLVLTVAGGGGESVQGWVLLTEGAF